ncbi:MAG: SBBP repeat-containing protein, partial [Bacteroidia bacterium]|nr:SBBP repeat-containing protein [Bacteroidia bacterium]
MKKTLLIGSILLSATFTKINAQTFAWAKNLGGTGSDVCTDVKTDVAGNIYSTGYFNGTVDFDPGAGTSNLTSAGGTDIFISKLNAAGNFVWALKMGGTTGDQANGIAFDAAGNIYTTGTFHGTVDFDPGAGVANLSNAAGGDVFVSKLTAAGSYVWVKQFGGNSNDHIGNDISVDTSGNVYTTGQFEGIVDFDPGTGTANLGNSSGSLTYFISKLDSSGNYVWAKQIGNTSSVVLGLALATTPSGDVYTTGYYNSSSLDFDPGTGSVLLSSGNYDIFINKFTAAGNFAWAKKMGGANNDEGLGLTLDASGNVYTTGFFFGTADFDPSAGTANLVSAGLTDIYINKLDPLGNYMWAKIGENGFITINFNGFGVDDQGNTYSLMW